VKDIHFRVGEGLRFQPFSNVAGVEHIGRLEGAFNNHSNSSFCVFREIISGFDCRRTLSVIRKNIWYYLEELHYNP